MERNLALQLGYGATDLVAHRRGNVDSRVTVAALLEALAQLQLGDRQ